MQIIFKAEGTLNFSWNDGEINLKRFQNYIFLGVFYPRFILLTTDRNSFSLCHISISKVNMNETFCGPMVLVYDIDKKQIHYFPKTGVYKLGEKIEKVDWSTSWKFILPNGEKVYIPDAHFKDFPTKRYSMRYNEPFNIWNKKYLEPFEGINEYTEQYNFFDLNETITSYDLDEEKIGNRIWIGDLGIAIIFTEIGDVIIRDAIIFSNYLEYAEIRSNKLVISGRKKDEIEEYEVLGLKLDKLFDWKWEKNNLDIRGSWLLKLKSNNGEIKQIYLRKITIPFYVEEIGDKIWIEFGKFKVSRIIHREEIDLENGHLEIIEWFKLFGQKFNRYYYITDYDIYEGNEYDEYV